MKYINREKLEKIQLNKENMYVAIDFDRTITSAKSADSWDATGKLLGKKFSKKLFELYEKYRPIELDYTISFEEKNMAMEKWYHECMDLYYEYKLTKNKLEESIKSSNLIFREGAKEFLCDMDKNNVPVVILSAGIGNVIEQFLKENNCLHKNISIISNFIQFEENGKMEEFTANMIHTLNKTMEGHLLHKKEELQQKTYRLLLGDVIEDKKMIEEAEWSKTITVGFLNEKIEENQKIYKENFDIVLTGEDATFKVVEEIVF